MATIGTGGVLVSSVKADGTFLAPVTLATDNPPIGLITGDLNRTDSGPGFDELERARVVNHDLSLEKRMAHISRE